MWSNLTITTHTSLIEKILNQHMHHWIQSIYRSITDQHISTFDQYKDQYLINIYDTFELTILYYNFKTCFYLLKQQNMMWNKASKQMKQQELDEVTHWQEWNSNPTIWSNWCRPNFQNNFCRICKLRKENWNKYNTIYLTTI